MSVLRGNRDMLVSVLESFIHDPLVEWNSKQSKRDAPAAAGAAAGAAGKDVVLATLDGAEKENRDGLRMIKRISERLDGQYNVGIDAVPARKDWKSSRNAAAYAGRGRPSAGSSTALSIPGQVHRLLREATSDENLALMYIGWMPFI